MLNIRRLFVRSKVVIMPKKYNLRLNRFIIPFRPFCTIKEDTILSELKESDMDINQILSKFI